MREIGRWTIVVEVTDEAWDGLTDFDLDHITDHTDSTVAETVKRLKSQTSRPVHVRQL